MFTDSDSDSESESEPEAAPEPPRTGRPGPGGPGRAAGEAAVLQAAAAVVFSGADFGAPAPGPVVQVRAPPGDSDAHWHRD